MKYLVETTGAFMLSDRVGDQEIPAERPAVVTSSNFVQSRVALNQLKILGKLKDEATDEEFAKFVKESDGDGPLAVSSFLSSFGFEEVTAKGDEAAPKKTKKL